MNGKQYDNSNQEQELVWNNVFIGNKSTNNDNNAGRTRGNFEVSLSRKYTVEIKIRNVKFDALCDTGRRAH